MNQTTKNTKKQKNIQQNTDFVDSKNGRVNKELILHNEDLESNIRKWKAPLKRGITMKTWGKIDHKTPTKLHLTTDDQLPLENAI